MFINIRAFKLIKFKKNYGYFLTFNFLKNWHLILKRNSLSVSAEPNYLRPMNCAIMEMPTHHDKSSFSTQ
jgi:hypothetical protein